MAIGRLMRDAPGSPPATIFVTNETTRMHRNSCLRTSATSGRGGGPSGHYTDYFSGYMRRFSTPGFNTLQGICIQNLCIPHFIPWVHVHDPQSRSQTMSEGRVWISEVDLIARAPGGRVGSTQSKTEIESHALVLLRHPAVSSMNAPSSTLR